MEQPPEQIEVFGESLSLQDLARLARLSVVCVRRLLGKGIRPEAILGHGSQRRCSRCGRPSPRYRCDRCRAAHNADVRAKRAKRIAEGLCQYCGQPASSDAAKGTCDPCYQRALAHASKRNKEKYAAGWCMFLRCEEPAIAGGLCEEHRPQVLADKIERESRTRERLKAAKVCTACRQAPATQWKMCDACREKANGVHNESREKKRAAIPRRTVVCGFCGASNEIRAGLKFPVGGWCCEAKTLDTLRTRKRLRMRALSRAKGVKEQVLARFLFQGQERTLPEISRLSGTSISNLRYRILKLGMSVEAAIVTTNARALPPDKRDQARQLYAQGSSFREIAEKLGIGRQTAAKYVEGHHPNTHPLKAKRYELKSGEKLTLTELAVRSGRNIHGLKQRLIRMDPDSAAFGEPEVKKLELTLHGQPVTVKILAELAGITTESIYQRLQNGMTPEEIAVTPANSRPKVNWTMVKLGDEEITISELAELASVNRNNVQRALKAGRTPEEIIARPWLRARPGHGKKRRSPKDSDG